MRQHTVFILKCCASAPIVSVFSGVEGLRQVTTTAVRPPAQSFRPSPSTSLNTLRRLVSEYDQASTSRAALPYRTAAIMP